SWFKGNIDKWAGKKLIVFCVGASPIENPEVEIALSQIFNESERKKAALFYCPGGLNYDKMAAPSKLMMKLFVKSLKAKKVKTQEDELMIKMISSSYDIAGKQYIEPILQCLKQ
ncbi:MAG: flavodoxin, partial [Lachnospiraceae bacterium]|nr:flavodoxin [Lachnospiraceae bacterium]